MIGCPLDEKSPTNGNDRHTSETQTLVSTEATRVLEAGGRAPRACPRYKRWGSQDPRLSKTRETQTTAEFCGRKMAGPQEILRGRKRCRAALDCSRARVSRIVELAGGFVPPSLVNLECASFERIRAKAALFSVGSKHR